jgi:hypothetical protein
MCRIGHQPHSITSSARPNSGSGTLMPRRLGSLEVQEHFDLGALLRIASPGRCSVKTETWPDALVSVHQNTIDIVENYQLATICPNSSISRVTSSGHTV